MKILAFPELRQTFEYDCGANAIQSVLVYYGIKVREEVLIIEAKTKKKKGTSVANMLKTLKKHGLKTKSQSMTFDNLKDCLKQKIPVIILLQAWSKKTADYKNDYHDGHWIVAIGFEKNKIFFEDPYAFERTFLSKSKLEERWHAKEGKKKFLNLGIAVFGKKPIFNPKKIIKMG